MQIISTGYNFKHNCDFKIDRPKGLEECLILIIRSSAVFSIQGETFPVEPGSVVFIDKRTPHSFHANSDVFVNDWVSVIFDNREYKTYIEQSIKVNTFFCSPDVSVCSEMIRLMQAENISDSVFRESNMLFLLRIILNKLADNSKNFYSPKSCYNELKTLRDKIYRDPSQKYTVQSLSDEVHLSPSYFQHLYKLYFGISPIADVINSRTEYSKQLLKSTSFSVSKIAEMLGYQSDMQFIKQFRQITKTTPSKYRSKN